MLPSVRLPMLLAAVLLPVAARAQTEGEAQDMALAALRLEFEHDNVAATPEDLDTQFRAACDRGYSPACRRSSWLVDGKAVPAKVVEVFQPTCESGDKVGCLAMAWALDRVATAQRNTEERDKTWRKAARVLKADCDGGFTPACHDYAWFLYDSKGLPSSDPRSALARWKSACDAGELASCTQLSKLSRDGGSGVVTNVAQARTYATRACDGGYLDGCAVLGSIDGPTWDAAKWDEFYGGLCDKGHRESCWSLSRRYVDGTFQEPTAGRLQGLFERGCALGHPQSCFEAGRWQQEHGGEDAKAAELFGRACDLGDASGCSAQVDMILAGKVQGSIREFYEAFDAACEQRQSVLACTQLGYALLDGTEVPRDAERGRRLLERVCVDAQSDPQACTVLGKCYEEGLGGERDRTEASKYFRWACSAGNAESCLRRGDLLVSDVGVRRDDHEALNMYQRACEGGLAAGCREAGRIVDEGTYVKQDLALAASLYEKACAANDGGGCTALGRVHERGTAGTPDLTAARDAYERALTAGSLDAKRHLARLLWNGYGGKKQRGRAKDLCREACQGGDAVACRGPAFL